MFSVSSQIHEFLGSYQQSFHQALSADIETLGEKSKLLDAINYALTSPGKRFRPIITLVMAKSLANAIDVMDAALSIEYMHTASLIIDDLPCMDDDEMRRGKPCLHKVFGETTALLASYTLINFAYEKIYAAGNVLKKSGLPNAYEASMIALGEAAKAAGIFGATGGQFLDLFPPKKSLEMIRRVIYQKTVCLFEIAFLFGWLFGGGDLEKITLVKTIAGHFGMAFQIADDLQDQAQDGQKSEGMNIALFLGREKAQNLFDEELEAFTKKLNLLSIDSKGLEKLKDLLVSYKNS